MKCYLQITKKKKKSKIVKVGTISKKIQRLEISKIKVPKNCTGRNQDEELTQGLKKIVT